MYKKLEKWLNKVLKGHIPQDVVALYFKLQENGHHRWSMELIGSNRFDPQDNTWSSEETFDFGTKKKPLTWRKWTNWQTILVDMTQFVKQYLENGCYAELLKSYQGIGIGFADKDLFLIHNNPEGKGKEKAKKASKKGLFLGIGVVILVVLGICAWKMLG